MRRLAILLLASLTFPASAAAQNSGVPLDLAKALLAGGGSPWDETQWVEIVVGGPPRQWKIEPLSSLRILGSAAFPNTATVVYAVDGDLATAQVAAIAEFEAAGWKMPPAPQRPASMESGFLSTMDGLNEGPRRPMCKGDRGVMVNPLEMPSGPRVLRVVYIGTFSSSMCNPPSPRTPYRDPWADAPMPKLQPPAGARVMSSGRGGGSHEFSSDAYAFTTLAVDKLFAHYADQMRAQGWQQEGAPAIGKTTALHVWQRKQGEADWIATMLVAASGAELRMLQLKIVNITEVSKRRGF